MVSALLQEHPLLPNTTHGAIWPFIRQYTLPSHFHAQLEFLLVLRGRALARVGRTVHAVHAGQLVWFLPGIEHELMEASSDLDFRVVQVEPDLCAEVGRMLRADAGLDSISHDAGDSFSNWTSDLGWLASGRPVVELKSADRDQLLESCDRTCHANGLTTQTPARVRSALACAWRATRGDHDHRRQSSLVELACCLLLGHGAQDRPAICRALGVSDAYLSRRFQAELGISFLEQRARLRVVRFLTYVTRERRTCLDAGLRAGFGSYSQLHRVFSDLVQQSPRSYLLGGGRNQRAIRRTI
jgi:AraC-like DNA-binding protein